MENTLAVHKYVDLLIDNQGKENAYIQRQEIEELCICAAKDRDTERWLITKLEENPVSYEDKEVLVG